MKEFVNEGRNAWNHLDCDQYLVTDLGPGSGCLYKVTVRSSLKEQVYRLAGGKGRGCSSRWGGYQ